MGTKGGEAMPKFPETSLVLPRKVQSRGNTQPEFSCSKTSISRHRRAKCAPAIKPTKKPKAAVFRQLIKGACASSTDLPFTLLLAEPCTALPGIHNGLNRSKNETH